MQIVRVDLWDEPLGYPSLDLGGGTLVGAIAKLNELAASVPAEYLNSVKFELPDEGYGEQSIYLKIWYERPKTDNEIERERIEQENRNRAAAISMERQERATYEALKAKYGE